MKHVPVHVFSASIAEVVPYTDTEVHCLDVNRLPVNCHSYTFTVHTYLYIRTCVSNIVKINFIIECMCIIYNIRTYNYYISLIISISSLVLVGIHI